MVLEIRRLGRNCLRGAGLLYRVTDEALILVRTGSHAELFGL